MMSPESLAAADGNIVRWFEQDFGGRVVDLARQTRWRPVWFATVDRNDGTRHELVVRGDRTDMPLIFPLEHEMTFQRLLGEHGIPVARVWGWIDEPMAYVMDRVGGQEHFAGTSDTDRAAAVDDYLAILARLHALPVEPFAAAGIRRAADGGSSAGLVGLRRYEEHYRSLKAHPDPFLEFCLRWLRRNPIDTAGREAPVVWDSGQFHHEDGRILAVLDLELGHLGDPMMDLAAWRMRDTIVGYGDMRELYARYEELLGAPVDLDAIRWHHLAFTLSNQLAYSHALSEPSAASDLMTNLQWCCETNLFATEAWAEHLGIDLPAVETPEPRFSTADVGHRHLVRALRSVSTDDPSLRHELRILFRLARHLQRRDEIGDAVDKADLDDLERLLGARPHDWRDGETKLEAFVLADTTGRHDAELVRLFHKRNLRAHMLLGPAGSAMTHHHTIQRF
ncbi:MAG: phosphotransferase family protein [Acidimicrobiaceae bacterium]|nr:phosphotransferase family protein [Acidimicrobiaceae bacterium]